MLSPLLASTEALSSALGVAVGLVAEPLTVAPLNQVSLALDEEARSELSLLVSAASASMVVVLIVIVVVARRRRQRKARSAHVTTVQWSGRTSRLSRFFTPTGVTDTSTSTEEAEDKAEDKAEEAEEEEPEAPAPSERDRLSLPSPVPLPRPQSRNSAYRSERESCSGRHLTRARAVTAHGTRV